MVYGIVLPHDFGTFTNFLALNMALFYPMILDFYQFFSSKYGIVLPHDFGTFTNFLALNMALFYPMILGLLPIF